MPTQISLLDIFNTESSLSDKILGENDSYVTVRINNTCSMFNKMTTGEIIKIIPTINKMKLAIGKFIE